MYKSKPSNGKGPGEPVTFFRKGQGIMSETQKGMESLMSEQRKFPPPANIQSNAWVNSMDQYQTMWDQSINDPDTFWLEQAKTLTWFIQLREEKNIGGIVQIPRSRINWLHNLL